MVALDAVIADAVDTDMDKARTMLDRPMHQKKACVAISAPICSTMAKSLQQI
jgi:hypothetical protein